MNSPFEPYRRTQQDSECLSPTSPSREGLVEDSLEGSPKTTVFPLGRLLNPGVVNLSNTHPEHRCVRRAGWFARYRAVGGTSALRPLLSPTKGQLEHVEPLP